MNIRLLTFGLLATLLTGCSLEDDRDECRYQVRLHYHETVDGVDQFQQDIKSMRHLLFDSDGRFVQWLGSTQNGSQDVDIGGLGNGTYTVITVANATEKTLFEDYDNINTFRVVHNARYTRSRADDGDESDYANTDELYWRKVTFTFDGTPQVVDCPLSNIHCHLHVRAEWKGVPKQSGLWTMRLYNVHTEYLAGETGLIINNRSHPVETDRTGTHRIESDTFNFELESEFVTFRWTNDEIPMLQIWCEDEPVTPLMDLKKAFDEWGWYPDRAQIQDYCIELLIGNDGTVDMRASGRANVGDWIDGGIIGY